MPHCTLYTFARPWKWTCGEPGTKVVKVARLTDGIPPLDDPFPDIYCAQQAGGETTMRLLEISSIEWIDDRLKK